MKNNTIAALVFGGFLAFIAVLNVPPVSDRINNWLGKDAAVEEQQVEAPAADKPAQADGQSVTETESRPTASAPADEAPEVSGEDSVATRMAPPQQDEAVAVPDVVVPSFGLLRVEPDGSTVIAGQAGPNAMVEVLSGEEKLAETDAEANGDFVAILETPLAPGDYELVLRSTEPDGDVAMSTETAIISVPEKGREGELLALVEQPGEASRLINTPKPAEPQAVTESEPPAAGQEAEPSAEAPVSETAEVGTDAPEAPADETAEAGSDVPQKTVEEAVAKPADIRIEAVEIDGDTVYVAGSAKPGAQVRVYANEILLGDTSAGPNGRFLIEVKKDLPVGDYIIRADVIQPGTAEVAARAAVPFTREEGERVAAVATAPSATANAEEETVSVPAPSTELPESPPDVPATVTVTGQLKRTNSSVIIRRGDTLWHISRRIYGEGTRYTTIYLANQNQIKDPDMIWPGQIFTLPENTDG